MKYAVEFTLDKALRDQIFHYWQRLCDHGLASPQTTARPYEPHISLMVFEDYRLGLIESLESMDYSDIDLSLSFHSFGLFKHVYSVLFLTPRTEFNWMSVHKDHYSLLKDSCKNIWDFYNPGRWNPHCSLTVDKSYEKILEALRVLDNVSFPLKGKIEKINLVDFKEGKVVYSRIIGN